MQNDARQLPKVIIEKEKGKKIILKLLTGNVIKLRNQELKIEH